MQEKRDLGQELERKRDLILTTITVHCPFQERRIAKI